MSDPTELVLLQECHSPMEVAQLRSVLDAHDIAYVVQGEHHAALIMGHVGGGPVIPRVLVAAQDVERARAMLAATPELKGDEHASPLGDAVCPVHEHPAIATCDRCGTFLCSQCDALGQPPLCEDCIAHEAPAAGKTLSEGQRAWRSQLAFLIPLGVLVALALLAAFVGQGFGH